MSGKFSQRLLKPLVTWFIGEKAIRRLCECDRLKTRAEHAAMMAGVCGLAMVNETTRAADVWMGSHDRLATAYNALRFWWMPRMALRLTDNAEVRRP